MDSRAFLLLLALGAAILTGCVSIGASSRTQVVATPPPRLTLQALPREAGVPLTVQASVKGLSHCVLTVTATDGSGGSTTLFHGAANDGAHPTTHGTNDAVLVIVPPGAHRLDGVAVCAKASPHATRHAHLAASVTV